MPSTQVSEPNKSGGSTTKVKPEHQSIYDVNAYKTYLRKLENSDKIVESFIQFLEQRLEVEDIYIQKLNNWDSKWRKNLETKADEFTKKSVSGIMSEASLNVKLHKGAHSRLKAEIDSLKKWRENHYPKKMFGGLKDVERYEKQFKEATLPYTNAIDHVHTSKVKYHQTYHLSAEAEYRHNADKENSQLKDDFEAKENEMKMAKISYEASIDQLVRINPVYEDQIRLGFSRIQELEKQRLAHTKEIARRYLDAINMTDTTDLKAEYERLKVIIGDANPDEIIEREASKLISNQDSLPGFEEAPVYQPPQQPTQKSTQSN